MSEKLKEFPQKSWESVLIWLRLGAEAVANRDSVLSNSLFLFGNTVVSSGLGFLFWIIATHNFASREVGIGAAYINVIALVAVLSDMGLGIAVIRYLVSLGNRQQLFVVSAAVSVCFFSILFSLIFVIGIPVWSKDLSDLSDSASHAGLFAASAMMFVLAQFMDNVFVALQKAHYLFARNLVAGILRIVFLYTVDRRLGASAIILAVGFGALISLFFSSLYLLPRTIPGFRIRPTFSYHLLMEKASQTLGYQVSQLLWAVPPLLYPLVVVKILGPEANARFYISWMIANLLFVIPVSVATSAFAKVSQNPIENLGLVSRYLKFTLLGLGLLVPVLLVSSVWLLGLFGKSYLADSALLGFLAFSALPFSVNAFAVVGFRLEISLFRLLTFSGLLTVLTMGLMVIGAGLGGLIGFGGGWMLAQLLGAMWGLYWLRQSVDSIALLKNTN